MRHDYIIKHCSYCCSDTIHYTWGRTESENGYCNAYTRCAVCGTVGGYGDPNGHPKLLSIYSEKYGVGVFLKGLDDDMRKELLGVVSLIVDPLGQELIKKASIDSDSKRMKT